MANREDFNMGANTTRASLPANLLDILSQLTEVAEIIKKRIVNQSA